MSIEYPWILSLSNESHLAFALGCPAKCRTVSTPSQAFNKVSMWSICPSITSPCDFNSSTFSGTFNERTWRKYDQILNKQKLMSYKTIKRRLYFSLFACFAKYLPIFPAAPVTRITRRESVVVILKWVSK